MTVLRFYAAIAVLFAAVFLASCSGPLKHKVSKDFNSNGIKKVALLPVVVSKGSVADAAEEARIKLLFYKNAASGLASRGYGVIAADEEVTPQTAFAGIAARHGADAILIVNVTDWHVSLLTPRASYKAYASYLLYNNDGALVWNARYKDKDVDYRFDKDALEIGVVKAYEARVENSSSLVFSKLPQAPLSPAPGKKGYFDWLK